MMILMHKQRQSLVMRISEHELEDLSSLLLNFITVEGQKEMDGEDPLVTSEFMGRLKSIHYDILKIVRPEGFLK